MNRRIVIALGVAGLAVVAWPASGADRDVQIRSIDFETGVVELFNFGDVDENLSGWRFCTHDNDQFRQYSGSSGLNGVVIESRTSLFIHFNNDGPSGSDDIDRAELGGFFATPLDSDAYGMGLYINGDFGSGFAIADHLQWSIDGQDNSNADERSDEAEKGGAWTDQNQWIATTPDSLRILLADKTGRELHGPDDYIVVEPGGCRRDPEWLCDGDTDGDGQINPVDSGLVQAAFGSTDEADLCQYDLDCDGQINPVDSGIVQSLFGTCEEPRDACP